MSTKETRRQWRLNAIKRNYQQRWSPFLVVITESTFESIITDIFQEAVHHETASEVVRALKAVYYDCVKVHDVNAKVTRMTINRHFKRSFTTVVGGKDPGYLDLVLEKKKVGLQSLLISGKIRRDVAVENMTLAGWCRENRFVTV